MDELYTLMTHLLLTIFELKAKSRRLKAQHNIELIILDYLQLMQGAPGGGRGEGGNRNQRDLQGAEDYVERAGYTDHCPVAVKP